MSRPKKNSVFDSKSKNVVSKPVVEEIKKTTESTKVEQQELKKIEEPIIDKKVFDEKKVIDNREFISTKDYGKSLKDTSNIKDVPSMDKTKNDYLIRRSEMIIKLKQNPQYKFLSKTTLIKIADSYLMKNY